MLSYDAHNIVQYNLRAKEKTEQCTVNISNNSYVQFLK